GRRAARSPQHYRCARPGRARRRKQAKAADEPDVEPPEGEARPMNGSGLLVHGVNRRHSPISHLRYAFSALKLLIGRTLAGRTGWEGRSAVCSPRSGASEDHAVAPEAGSPVQVAPDDVEDTNRRAAAPSATTPTRASHAAAAAASGVVLARFRTYSSRGTARTARTAPPTIATHAAIAGGDGIVDDDS